MNLAFPISFIQFLQTYIQLIYVHDTSLNRGIFVKLRPHTLLYLHSSATLAIRSMFALCRPALLINSPFRPSLPFHRYPPSSCKITLLPLRCPNSNFAVSSSSMESPPPGYRRNVGICLINQSNKIFSASRIDIPGAWQMPQGGVDEGEDPRDAAVRELREETGVTSAEIVAEAPHWLTYDFPPEVRVKLNQQWGTDWSGQAQKWFLFRFTGKDEEINLSGDGSEKPEFAEWSWMTPPELIDRAVDFKKPVYEEVLKVFSTHLQSAI